MTNEEIICEFMEPRSHERPGQTTPKALLGSPWWDWAISYGAFPKSLTLDRLHEVEARLTDEQWVNYIAELLLGTYDDITGTHRRLVHASTTQKIKALASVLKGAPRG